MKQNYMNMPINQLIKMIEDKNKKIFELENKLSEVCKNIKIVGEQNTKFKKDNEIFQKRLSEILGNNENNKYKWNYDINSCPLNTEVYLLLRNATYVCEESIYTGIITKEPYGDSKIKWDCRKYFSGNPNNFYQDAIVAWKPYKDND